MRFEVWDSPPGGDKYLLSLPSLLCLSPPQLVPVGVLHSVLSKTFSRYPTMISFIQLVCLAFALSYARLALAQASDPSIATPASLVVCQNSALTVTGTNPPFMSVPHRTVSQNVHVRSSLIKPLVQFPPPSFPPNPFRLSAVPGGNPSTILETIGTTNAGSFTWKVDIAAGTTITLQARDSKGNIGFSGQVTIQVRATVLPFLRSYSGGQPQGTGDRW